MREKVEHENWVSEMEVIHRGEGVRPVVVINKKRHRVYPTGHPQEPWTTNTHHMNWYHPKTNQS